MRTWGTAAAAIIATGRARLELLVHLALSTDLRLTTAMDTATWDGHTWLATRGMASVEPIKDDGDTPAGLRFAITGARPDNLATALTEKARGRACTLYVAIYNNETDTLIEAQPECALVLDQISISDSAPDASGQVYSTISVSARHLGALFARPKPVYYTDTDQQRLYPGDHCLEFINEQTSTEVVWPEAAFYRA